VPLILDLKPRLSEQKAVFPPTPPRLSEWCVEGTELWSGEFVFSNYFLRNGSPLDSSVLGPWYCERRRKSNNDVEETRSSASQVWLIGASSLSKRPIWAGLPAFIAEINAVTIQWAPVQRGGWEEWSRLTGQHRVAHLLWERQCYPNAEAYGSPNAENTCVLAC